MKLNLDGVPVEEVRRVKAVLEENGISDADIALQLDIAGDIMRENKVFTADVSPLVRIYDSEFDHPKMLYLYYLIKKPLEFVQKMKWEFFDRTSKLEGLPYELHISFRMAE